MDKSTGQPDIIKTQIEDLADTKPEAVLDKTVFEEKSVGKPDLKVAQLSDVGAVRQRNEDSSLIFRSESGGHSPLLPVGLYIVADGMGGHDNGHLASKVASRAAAQHILKEFFLSFLDLNDPPQKDEIQKIMKDAVQAAHEAVYDPDPAKDGGTTLTSALVVGQDLYVAHVGDSRAYWLVDGLLEAISIDHSLVQRLQDEGQLTPEEAQHYQYRNVLLRALGQEDPLEIDTYYRSLPGSGKLLLCSDGLCGLVEDQVLQEIMNQPSTPHATAKKLVAAALAAGGFDNITAVVVEFSF